jgi:hypothetical protein
MNMGERVSNYLCRSDITDIRLEIKGFLEHVQCFYVEAALQIRKRFPINDDILKSLSFLNPQTIHATPSNDIITLASKFPNIIPTVDTSKIDDEWRELQFMNPNDLPALDSGRRDVVTFWGEVSKMTDTSNEARFPTISLLAKSFLAFPHSNADVERIFSQISLIKTKRRNKLKTNTMNAILVAKQGLPLGNSCKVFEPDRSMYQRMNTTMYNSESSDTESD